MRALILAGGQGSRVQHIWPDIPKVLFPVGDKSFLEYQLAWLARWKLDVTLCLGHLYQPLVDYFGDRVEYSIEDEPLGTGGALKNVKRRLRDTFLVLNGDTYYEIDLTDLIQRHWHNGGLMTMALWPELVNGGVYACEPAMLSYIRQGSASLEEEVIPLLARQNHLRVHVAPGYHVDIGTPDGYSRAQAELPGRWHDLLL